ncbi:methyltransferase family protein [Adhaeribacter terreus]|uniref:Methyltransferase family protein n=1 Tax=Adhaeribacter terreus TaxID=529703 RepID=A0ABW0ED37_9BACT
MPLREEFELSGNWLFRRRSWLPLVLYVFALCIMLLYPEDTHRSISHTNWGLFCLGISFLGLVVRAITIGFTPKGTSGRNTEKQVADTLNRTGIYSVVRHPLYLGNFLMWLGLFLYIGLWWFVLICCLAYWLYYERIMYAEEEFLRKTYGAEYETWAERTPAFLPALTGWVSSPASFSFKNVLKREYNGLFAMFFSFAALNAISYFMSDGLFYMDPVWQLLLLLCTGLFVLLRFLRKNTKLLDEPGR